MGLLNRDSILAADDLPTVDVDAPEWGGVVRLRMLTTAERVAWNISIRPDAEKPVDFANAHARLVALCAVGEDGQRLFADAEAAELGQKSGAVMARLFAAAREVSKLGEAEVEAEVKKSGTGPSAGSSSDSASNSESSTPTTCLAH